VAVETKIELLAEIYSETQPRKRTPRRQALLPQLPHTEICHDPESKQCQFGCAPTRMGEDISEKLDYTLAAWVGRCGVGLTPLVERPRRELLKQPVLHADETPVSMLSPTKKRTHRAYIWAYATTPDDGNVPIDNNWVEN